MAAPIGPCWATGTWVGWVVGSWGAARPHGGASYNSLRVIMQRLKKRREDQRRKANRR